NRIKQKDAARPIAHPYRLRCRCAEAVALFFIADVCKILGNCAVSRFPEDLKTSICVHTMTFLYSQRYPLESYLIAIRLLSLRRENQPRVDAVRLLSQELDL